MVKMMVMIVNGDKELVLVIMVMMRVIMTDGITGCTAVDDSSSDDEREREDMQKRV